MPETLLYDWEVGYFPMQQRSKLRLNKPNSLIKETKWVRKKVTDLNPGPFFTKTCAFSYFALVMSDYVCWE